MISNKQLGRHAGIAYFILVLTGIFSLMYVPSQIYVSGDPVATAANIRSSESLFRLGITAEIISNIAFLLLPLLLYRLFYKFNKTASVLMVTLAVISIPVTLANIQNEFSAIALVQALDFPTAELESEVMFYMKRYFNGHLIAQIFWALWLFPLGYMVYKSGYIPKILGVFLMVGCLGYLIEFFGLVLLPDFRDLAIAPYVTIPASIGEIGTCLWLLIMGARETKSN